jgi:hypothetical protein
MNKLLGGFAVALLLLGSHIHQASAQLASSSGARSVAGAQAYNAGNYNYFAGSHIPSPVPDVLAPPLTGGANVCIQSTAGGVGVQSFGISFGSTYADEDCRKRAWYINMMNTWVQTRDSEYLWVARALACSAEEVRSLGVPGFCTPAAAPQARSNPALVTYTQPVYTPNTGEQLRDWCLGVDVG